LGPLRSGSWGAEGRRHRGPADLPPLEDPGPATPPPNEPKASPDVARGVSALEANDVPGATAAFQSALRANPKDADALYYLGGLAEKAGDLAAAETSYKAALAARPDFPRAEGNLGAIYDDAQRFDDALALVQPGLALHPKDATLHLDAAIAYAGKKDVPSAVREFDAAVALSPKDPAFRLVYGHWLAVLGQGAGATTQLKAAVPLAGKDVGVVAAIGHELHMIRAYGDCISVLTQALGLRDAAELWTERASCKIASNDDAGAVTDLRTATTKEPGYAPGQYYLGNELVKAGDYPGAIAAYQAFLKLEPNGALAKGVQEKLRLAKQHAH